MEAKYSCGVGGGRIIIRGLNKSKKEKRIRRGTSYEKRREEPRWKSGLE